MSVSGGFIRTSDGNLACFELAGRVLYEGLKEVRDFYAGGMVCASSALPVMLGHAQMADYAHSRVTALMGWLDEIALVVNNGLPSAMQAPLREDAILSVCDRMILFGHRLVAWEHDVAGHSPPAHWHCVISLLRGMTEPLVHCLFQQADGIAALPSWVRAGETHIDLNIRVPNLPQFALLADELPRAWKAGTPVYERHPILSALFLGALLTR